VPGGHGMLRGHRGQSTAHDSAVTGVVATHDGRHWLSAGADNVVRRWDSQSRQNTLVHYPQALNSAHHPRQLALDHTSQVRIRSLLRHCDDSSPLHRCQSCHTAFQVLQTVCTTLL
jgi:WD40 repeat protein